MMLLQCHWLVVSYWAMTMRSIFSGEQPIVGVGVVVVVVLDDVISIEDMRSTGSAEAELQESWTKKQNDL